ncbi:MULTISPECIES: molybdenum cofactor biosynthesis protein MoaE [Vogesella]|uniref:molybdenum cofactor biosynthesis protein MoaE n=1 Tax=Vogesella TaxID=57739 RepID=UPI00210BA528|nr:MULTISPECIES: molybdenum cofactor biosynthesis protein MoaE [Vogesella]MCQ4143280.1 molybdenum cofactor biosynthesis protein MoaE [Vogesella sp. AC12]MDC7697957.1 molybdenum cofactor biosynthesis protein MoaE [Vogesella indigofera]
MYCDITVQTAAFDLGAEELALRAHAGDAGALVAFQGMVRAHDEAVPLAALFLEHYPGVTEAEIRRIAEQAAARWPVSACRVIHRVGALAPGEPIVLVLIAAGHRAGAFAAAEYLMDYLKTQAPFWKREDFVDGSSRWVEAKASDDAACGRWHD